IKACNPRATLGYCLRKLPATAAEVQDAVSPLRRQKRDQFEAKFIHEGMFSRVQPCIPFWSAHGQFSPKSCVRDSLAPRLNSFGDDESVDEVSGCESRSHGAESPQKIQKRRPVFRRDLPQRFILENVQAEVPAFGTVLVQNFAVYDLKTIRPQQSRIIFHGVQFDEYALLYRLDDFLVLTLGEPFLLNPIGDAQRPSRLQALRVSTRNSSSR